MVPNPSTILARRCLTSVIGRERVYPSWYGRRRFNKCFLAYKYSLRILLECPKQTHSYVAFEIHEPHVSEKKARFAGKAHLALMEI